MQILPQKHLSDIIKHYLFLDIKEMESGYLRLFSDCNNGMLFNARNSLSLNHPIDKDSTNLPNSFLYGQITKFKDIYIDNDLSVVIVVFQPSGLYKLLGLSAFELRDCIVSSEEIFGHKIFALEEQIAYAYSIKDKLVLLNTFFTNVMSVSKERSNLVSELPRFIINNNGIISSSQLVNFAGYTEGILSEYLWSR